MRRVLRLYQALIHTILVSGMPSLLVWVCKWDLLKKNIDSPVTIYKIFFSSDENDFPKTTQCTFRRRKNSSCAKTHHYFHVGQLELSVEGPSVDRTNILHSSKGRHGDGLSHGQYGQAVSEPSINPFLIRQNQAMITTTRKKSSCDTTTMSGK